MTIIDEQSADRIGPVATREFESAPDWAKPKLRAWIDSLPTLTDTDFLSEAASAIHGSALAMRFSGNWEHEHCKATVAYREAKFRHEAAGHSQDCHGDTIYCIAHAQVMRSQGHVPAEPVACTCGMGVA